MLRALIALLLLAAPAQAAKLTWAPWADTPGNTIYVQVPSTGLDIEGDPTKDYVLVWPSSPVTPKPGAGCVRLDHARMVRMIGGECYIPPQPFTYNAKTRRCLSFNDVRWWLHVEGVWCHGDVLDFAEYFGSNAAVTYENDRVEGVTARDEYGFSDGHPDGVYISGASATPGARSVRIDRLTVETDYQAVFFAHWTAGTATNYPITMLNTNLRGTPIPGTMINQLIWRADPANAMKLLNVYLEPQTRNGQPTPLAKAVKPSDVDPCVPCRAVTNADGSVSWPAAAAITGVVRPGLPPGGDFVSPGVAGVGYVSPGYGY